MMKRSVAPTYVIPEGSGLGGPYRDVWIVLTCVPVTVVCAPAGATAASASGTTRDATASRLPTRKRTARMKNCVWIVVISG